VRGVRSSYDSAARKGESRRRHRLRGHSCDGDGGQPPRHCLRVVLRLCTGLAVSSLRDEAAAVLPTGALASSGEATGAMVRGDSAGCAAVGLGGWVGRSRRW
jgi:hypothetical protein